MNQTSFNQSTHCIFAIGPLEARYVEGNRSLRPLKKLSDCSYINKLADDISGFLSTSYGVLPTP